jgi:quinol monooxygenase YgiN
MATKVSVFAYIHAKPGKEEATKQALLALVAPTRAEEGCLNYDLHQSPADRTKFIFYENWTSRELLEKHLNSAHIAAFRARVPELLTQPPDIQIWEMVSTPAK